MRNGGARVPFNQTKVELKLINNHLDGELEELLIRPKWN